MQQTSYKYDIVIIGLQPWNISLGSNCIDIAKVFSRFCRVLFVNRATDQRSELVNYLKGIKSLRFKPKINQFQLVNVQDNIWVLDTGIVLTSINLFKGKLYKFLLRRNNQKFASQIKRGITQLGFKDVILFNDNDFFNGQFLKEDLAPQLYIYYLRDYLIEQSYFMRNGKLMEQALIRKADYVFTNSTYLNNYAKQYNSSSVYVGQGTNLNIEHADQIYKRPLELEGINTPIIGYVGNLVTLRLDLELLENVVPMRKDLNWVFVGPFDKAFEKSILRQYKHVLFTGPKSQSDLPHYIDSFDVCLNPQLLNKTTIGNYPRKVDEYMLFGKPVVARKTDFTEELGDLVYTYEGQNDFLLQLDSALAEQVFSEKRTLRKKSAQSHTWENSVNSMFEAMGIIIKL